MFLIKAWSLEAVTAEQYDFAAVSAGLLFGGCQQGAPIVLAAAGWVNPKVSNFTSLSPCPAGDACQDFLPVVTDKESKQVAVILPGLCAVEIV